MATGKPAHQYKNTKRKLYKTNAAIWYNKTCRQKTTHPEIYQYPYQWQQPTMPKNTQSSNPFPQSKAIAENKNAIVASCWTYFTTIGL
jgi:hypothetical protein